MIHTCKRVAAQHACHEAWGIGKRAATGRRGLLPPRRLFVGPHAARHGCPATLLEAQAVCGIASQQAQMHSSVLLRSQ